MGDLTYKGPTSIEYSVNYEELFSKKDFTDTLQEFAVGFRGGCKESRDGCIKLCTDCCRLKKIDGDSEFVL